MTAEQMMRGCDEPIVAMSTWIDPHLGIRLRPLIARPGDTP